MKFWLGKFMKKRGGVRKYVTAVEVQSVRDKNASIREQLIANGDDCTAVRRVDYGFAPKSGAKTEEALSALYQRMSGLGLAHIRAGDQNYQSPRVESFYDHREVASKAFDDWTQVLDDVANECGWVFDGWETFVIRTETEKDKG